MTDHDRTNLPRPEDDGGSRVEREPDPLLQPSVGPPPAGPAPWRTSSMFFVGFFGGPLAVGLLATLNARRLGAPSQTAALIAGASLVLLAGWVTYAVAFFEPGRLSLRLATALAGVVAHLVQQQLLARQARVAELRGQEPAPMWLPGIAAVVGSIVVSSMIAAALDVPQL